MLPINSQQFGISKKTKTLGLFIFVYLIVVFVLLVIFTVINIHNGKELNQEKAADEVEIHDKLDVLDNEQELEDILISFAEEHQIYTVVYTIYEDEWSGDYSTLEEYTLDKYEELYSDQRHVLIVYSIPRSQVEDYRSGNIEIPDYYWELVQGGRCDAVLTESVLRVFVHCVSEHMENGDNPGDAFIAGFYAIPY